METRRQALIGVLCIAPYALFIAVLIGWPLVAILLKSLSEAETMVLGFLLDPAEALAEPMSAANYWSVLTEPKFRSIFANTLILAVSVATSLTIVACLVGYFISRNRRWRGTVTAIITFPSLAPAITVIYGVLLVLSPLGPLNHLIVNGLHLSAAPIRMTGTMVAVVLGDFALFATLAVRMMASLFDLIDPAIEQASESLGATAWQTFSRVTLPLALPGLAAVWIFVFIKATTAYVAALLLGGGTTGVVVVALEIYSQVQGLGISATLGQVCALAVMLALGTMLGRALYLAIVRRAFAERLAGEAL
jgi:ABC-type spermidine/putrescine transport system permease subunit I